MLYDKQIKEKDKVWVACALDAEGWIGYRLNKYVRIQVVNTNLDFIKNVQRIMGGMIKLKKVALGFKQQYVVELNTQGEVLRILREILPYLIIKKQRAINAIRWIE